MITKTDGSTSREGRKTVLIRSMPSDLWRCCKSEAPRRGQSLREFVIEALERSLIGGK